jgi:release factor glutamine methyltransferase
LSKLTRSVLVDIELRLKNAGVPSPRVDAESIVAFSLGIDRSRVGLVNEINDDQYREIEKLVEKRVRRIPLQHLLGEQGFRRLVLDVGPGVFIPRPETELLVESTVRYLNDKKQSKNIVVDLCSGSGAIALALATEVNDLDVYAVEKSPEAFHFLRKNLEKNEELITLAKSRFTAINADIIDSIKDLENLKSQVDALVSNPPYIPNKMIPREPEVKDHEPEMALFGGKDGLDVVRVVIKLAQYLLKPGGFIAIEHADVQGSNIEESGVPYLLLESKAFTKVEDRRDLNGLPRYTVGIKI